jgi:hypothetical protein
MGLASVLSTLVSYLTAVVPWIKFILGRLGKVFSRLLPGLMMIRSKKVYIAFISVSTFTGTVSNLYLAVRRLDPIYLGDAVLSAALTIGGSVDRALTGLRLFNGSVTPRQVMENTIFLQGVPGPVESVLAANGFVLAVFLLGTALGTLYIYNVAWNLVIRFLESTDPAAGHNLLKVGLLLALLTVYSFVEQSGFSYMAEAFNELMQTVDSLAANQSGNVTGNLSGGVGNTSG